MDTELKRLAALALSNALIRDLTELSAAYIAAARGLDADDVLSMAMSHADELLYESRAVEPTTEINVWTKNTNGTSVGHATLLDALNYKRAVDVHVNGKRVFHRECGGLWQYVEGTSSGS